MKIRIGSRESRLAVVQSELLIKAISGACSWAEPQLVTMKTTGDKILDKTLDQVGGKGLFVKELDRALLEGRIDFAVHSLKDMPMETPESLPIVAFSRREDPRDVLVLPEGQKAPDPEKPIGSSSRRRQLQLEDLFPGFAVKPVRGNVLTRLEKLEAGEYGALVLAAAGLKRLGLEHRIARYFSPEEMVPAAGQGILAVQARRGADISCLKEFQNEEAACCALAERAFVRTLDGGCSAPVAAYGVLEGGRLTLTGFYASAGGAVRRKGSVSGPGEQGEALGKELACRLKEGGGAL